MKKEEQLHDILELFEIGEIDFDETKKKILILFGDKKNNKPQIIGGSTFIKKLKEQQKGRQIR